MADLLQCNGLRHSIKEQIKRLSGVWSSRYPRHCRLCIGMRLFSADA